jgi:uncharacterized DUF497 family protein
MITASFVWDVTKAELNLKKHKIPFEEAQTVFSDPNARMIFDPEHSGDEDRFILLGISSGLRLLVVCHCWNKLWIEIACCMPLLHRGCHGH